MTRVKEAGNQPELFGEVAHARATDPGTSHEAARKITPALPVLQQRVLDTLALYGPCTDRVLVTVLKGTDGRTESTWRTRRSELVAKGLVELYGIENGHSVWRVKENSND